VLLSRRDAARGLSELVAGPAGLAEAGAVAGEVVLYAVNVLDEHEMPVGTVGVFTSWAGADMFAEGDVEIRKWRVTPFRFVTLSPLPRRRGPAEVTFDGSI
jgi:hypothetical protein